MQEGNDPLKGDELVNLQMEKGMEYGRTTRKEGS